MDKPESEFIKMIANNEQLYDAYPELFEVLNISNSEIYLEKANPRKEEFFEKKDRIFLLPSGIISVTTLELDYLWDIGGKDSKILGEFNLFTEELNRKRINKEDFDYFQKKNINGRDYGINYYPYNDEHSNREILDRLDKKLLSLRGLPGR